MKSVFLASFYDQTIRNRQKIVCERQFFMTGNNPIDIVLPWVDEKDPAWEQNRKKYAKKEEASYETSNVRFESWDNLQLWFRAIERCMPWVNRIF